MKAWAVSVAFAGCLTVRDPSNANYIPHFQLQESPPRYSDMQTAYNVNIEAFFHELQLYNQRNSHLRSYPSPCPIRRDFQNQHRNGSAGCQLRKSLSNAFFHLPFLQSEI